MQVINQPTSRRGRPPIYDWSKLLDGSWRRLKRDDDFPTVASAHNFRMMAYTAASRIGKGVHVYIEDDNTLTLQGYDK